MSKPAKKCVCPPGAPLWMATFADMMTLLLCFFVLLLSFSEMDVQKFKQIAGSISFAFGIQRDITAHEIPKGTSVVQKEYSPAVPQPTLINSIRQMTTDLNKRILTNPISDSHSSSSEETEDFAKSLATMMSDDLQQGNIELETKDQKIIIRILEKGSFKSGSDILNDDFYPVIARIRDGLLHVPGSIKITGHTDNIPIHTTRFRSNWDLSSARAASVLHALLGKDKFDTEHKLKKGKKLQPDRFVIVGYADTRPLYPNTTVENRARNRRVDIVIQQGDDLPARELQSEDIVLDPNEADQLLQQTGSAQEKAKADDVKKLEKKEVKEKPNPFPAKKDENQKPQSDDPQLDGFDN